MYGGARRAWRGGRRCATCCRRMLLKPGAIAALLLIASFTSHSSVPFSPQIDKSSMPATGMSAHLRGPVAPARPACLPCRRGAQPAVTRRPLSLCRAGKLRRFKGCRPRRPHRHRPLTHPRHTCDAFVHLQAQRKASHLKKPHRQGASSAPPASQPPQQSSNGSMLSQRSATCLCPSWWRCPSWGTPQPLPSPGLSTTVDWIMRSCYRSAGNGERRESVGASGAVQGSTT